MKIDIVTLFPSMFAGPFDTSMLKKAKDNGATEITIHDLRGWAIDKHKSVDDRPYGGGPGMVIRVDVVEHALQALGQGSKNTKTILLSPQGKIFSQKRARELAKLEHLILLAGHYEGFDERIHHLIDEEISVGDYVLTGGEIPAMIITDAVVRLLPGVLEDDEKASESFSDGSTFDYPVYTRPEEYMGWKVPGVLLAGDHKRIAEWRIQMALKKTARRS